MAARDSEALGILYDRHAGLLFSLACAICRDDRDAEEAVSDAFHQAWETADRYDAGRGSPAGWLVAMTRSRALDRVRKVERRAAMLDGAAPDLREDAGRPDRPDEALRASETKGIVSSALDQLSDLQREAIQLAYFEGLSQSEIGERLGVPLGTIKTRIRDGMIRLKASLGSGTEVGVR